MSSDEGEKKAKSKKDRRKSSVIPEKKERNEELVLKALINQHQHTLESTLKLYEKVKRKQSSGAPSSLLQNSDEGFSEATLKIKFSDYKEKYPLNWKERLERPPKNLSNAHHYLRTHAIQPLLWGTMSDNHDV